ncbi:MAG: hypothetical protein HFG54_07815 [Lachnospiraceae bacterium]|jgi:hypothetical protein|nr:hypothetical protein [Lachnospiraceae bacterium]
MKERKQKEKRPVLQEQELTERKLAMEKLHPGYIDMELRLGVWLGFVMIGRIFLYGLNIVLGVQRGIFLILLPFGLLMCFAFYSVCIRQQWKLSWAFLIFRVKEFSEFLYKTIPEIIYLNFWGDIWWVTTVGVVILDISFLMAVAFSPSIHRFVENDKIVYSRQVIGNMEEDKGFTGI